MLNRLPSCLCLAALVLSGCDNMGDQPKLEAYEATPFLPEGMVAQHAPRHTLTFAEEPPDPAITRGRVGNDFVTEIPIPINELDLRRGQDLFGAYCAPCHGYAGHGDGLVVKRGFPNPPTFHSDRLRQAPSGYLYTVLNEGYGVMLPYGARLPLEDRWRVIAYLRVLQLSQHATEQDIPPASWASLSARAGKEAAP